MHGQHGPWRSIYDDLLEGVVVVRICIRGLYHMCLGLIRAESVYVSVIRVLYKLWHCVPPI
jgi:hypothetical protein